MIWIFPEYGGQIALRIENFKLVRQALKTPSPGPWEVYDLSRDPAEANNLAGARPGLISAAETLLQDEVDQNSVFPVPLPGPAAAVN
jgi:arylsulfatase A-like enzyme